MLTNHKIPSWNLNSSSDKNLFIILSVSLTLKQFHYLLDAFLKQIAKEMTTVISNLLEARESVLIESDNKNHSSKR